MDRDYEPVYEPKRGAAFKIAQWFKVSESYVKETRRYYKTDAWLAILIWFVWCITLLALYWSVRFFALAQETEIYYPVPAAAIVILCLIVFTIGPLFLAGKLRKQKVLSIGFKRANVLKSLALGGSFSLLYVLLYELLFNLIVRVLAADQPRSFELNAPTAWILLTAFNGVVIIPFLEEVIFRSYIGTRLYGVFKDKFSAIFVTGLLFALPHYIAPGININIGSMVFFVSAHCLFHWMYAKYNNIWGPMLLHACINFVGHIERLLV